MAAPKKNNADGAFPGKLQMGYFLAIFAFLFWTGYNYKELSWAGDRVDLLIARERDLRERVAKLEAQEQIMERELKLFDYSDERADPKGRAYPPFKKADP